MKEEKCYTFVQQEIYDILAEWLNKKLGQNHAYSSSHIPEKITLWLTKWDKNEKGH